MKNNTEIKSTFDLLKKGDEEIKLYDQYKNVVLVLGNTGVGKSTFTQWIAGDNDKLIAKEIGVDTGEFIIQDHNRISDSTVQSKTTFPELVIDSKTNTPYYDCPGFDDSRSTANDIASTYFIKKVMDHINSTKMIFLINYSSVRSGVDRKDFLLLIKHATDLIKDIDKFRNSIALVVTKVDNQIIQRGNNYMLLEDSKVIGTIADFLQEVKEDCLTKVILPNISIEDKKYNENAIKFINILLVKKNEKYSKIGIFRRPNKSGVVSNITLLQEGKDNITKLLQENLNFTLKNDDDFGYTISDKSKLEINDLIEEINNNIWLNVSNIAEKIKKYYRDLVEQLLSKIKLFVSSNNVVDVNNEDAQKFLSNFNQGRNITSTLVEQIKNLSNPEELAKKISNNINGLDINTFKDDLFNIAEQGKHFNFFQIVSDRELKTRKWVKPFDDVSAYFPEAKKHIQDNVKGIAIKINYYLNDTKKILHEYYGDKSKLLEIQKLPAELKVGHTILSNLTKQIENIETVSASLKTIQIIDDSVNNLGIRISRKNIIIITNRKKYHDFLQLISDKNMFSEMLTWICPIKDAAEYLQKWDEWYKYLNSLYSKFSKYEIQKDKSKYNVADITEWGKNQKQQGINITKNNFQKFLNITEEFHIAESNNIKKIVPTELQLEELNHVLFLTLKSNVLISCKAPYMFVTGDYIMTRDFYNVSHNIQGHCENFSPEIKFNFINIFAAHTIFIDEDFSLQDSKLPITIIAPKWEIIGQRKIDLNGSKGKTYSGSKATGGTYPGSDGADGSPGGHGRPGGIFFGIGEKFINGENLSVTAIGGDGGSGQAGGNGANGENGDTPYVSSEAYSFSYMDEFSSYSKTERTCDTKHSPFISASVDNLFTIKTCRFQIFGTKGTKGGNGGNGGCGGKGGDTGNITLFELYGNSTESNLNSRGMNGKDGSGGKGGIGGKNGNDLFIQYNPPKNWFEWQIYLKIEKQIDKGREPSGTNGRDGANTKGMEDFKAAKTFSKLSKAKVINEFKNYLRKDLNDRFKKFTSKQFLKSLDSNNNIKDIYETLGFVDELQGLENQYCYYNKKVDFLPLYQSLLKRISEYAQYLQNVENSNEHKKILNYLYTTTLSKIYSLKENFESNLIINITEYFNSIKEDFDSLKDLLNVKNKADIINKYKIMYKGKVDIKIKEGENFIETEITPEISKINAEIDSQIETLIKEVIDLQMKTKEHQNDLIEKRKKLRKNLEWQALFSSIKIIGQLVSVLGPYGKIAGAIIDSGTQVAETLVLDNQSIQGKTFKLPESVSNLDSVIDQMNISDKKVILLNELLEEMSQEMIIFPEKLNTTSEKIDNIKSKLNKRNKNKLDFEKIAVIEEELIQELKSAEKELVQIEKVSINKKKDKKLEVIEKFSKKIIALSALGVDMYLKYKNSNAELDEITKAIEEDVSNFQMLKQYERRIHNTIGPILQNLKNNVDDINNKLGKKSKIALEITKWQIQSTLKDTILQMQLLTQGFPITSTLARCIKKLEEAETTLINVYDHIQNYQEQQEFANYIADISSSASNDLLIVDPELKGPMNYLDITIKSNIILKRYKIAIDAFKQFVFPVAHDYFKQLMLPSELELLKCKNDTNLENLILEAAKQIEHIKLKLRDYKTSITKHDSEFGSGEFNSNHDSTQPFYIWKNEQNKNAISKLLSGQEVIIKADIKTSLPREEAIKFNVIEFNFKSKNMTRQREIDNILKSFKINITHLGNSYYQYGDKIYLIITNSQNIRYHIEKNEKNEPVRVNDVYKKIKNGDFMLSPYCLWTIKLSVLTNKNNYSFRNLKPFKDEIDLELGGNGHYLDKEEIHENLSVERYYKAIDVHKRSDFNTDEEFNTVSSLETYNSIRNKRATNLKLITINNQNNAVDKFHDYNISPTPLINSASSSTLSPINIICNWFKEKSMSLTSNALVLLNYLPTLNTVIFDKDIGNNMFKNIIEIIPGFRMRENVTVNEITNNEDDIFYDAQEHLSEHTIKTSLVIKSLKDEEYYDALGDSVEITKSNPPINRIKIDKATFEGYPILDWQIVSNNSNLNLFLTGEESNNIQFDKNLEVSKLLILTDVFVRSITGVKYKQATYLSPMQKKALEILEIKQNVYEGLQDMSVNFEDYSRQNEFSE